MAKKTRKVAGKKELSDLAKSMDAMQKRLDKGEYLSKKEVSSMVRRFAAAMSGPIGMASW